MQTKYYIDANGPDKDAFIACIKKAIELSFSDTDVNRIVLYSNTKNNFELARDIFGTHDVDFMFQKEMKIPNCTAVLRCATKTTYKQMCHFLDNKKDIVICCHMDSKDIYPVDDMPCVKYVVALSWTPDGLSEWKQRWGAENILNNESQPSVVNKTNPLLAIALNEMNEGMLYTKCIGHQNDEETCKTYIRAIHKYLLDTTAVDIQNYLVIKLNWESSDADEVGKLLQKLIDGRTFQGGQKTHLREYYLRWKEKADK